MNNRLNFEKEVGWAIGIKDEDVLLGYFVSEIKYNINEVIADLESVLKGEKTFVEILEHPQVAWDFGEGSGQFECSENTAYFIADKNTNLPSMQMPLKELIEILYEWKIFLNK